jgi:hypothetical protein
MFAVRSVDPSVRILQAQGRPSAGAAGRAAVRGSSTALVLAAALACSETSPSTDAGAPAPDTSVVRVREAPPLPEAGPLRCGAEFCHPAVPGALGARRCCLDAGACGLSTAHTGALCLEPESPGHPDLGCPSLALPGGPVLQGCCDPSGACGIFDRFGVTGCIPRSALGMDPVDCTPVEAATCHQIVEIPCDGPEDCATGLECCGRVASDGYDAFGCFPDCTRVTDGSRGVWVSLCHLGQTCSREGHGCIRDPDLPEPYARCSPSGDVASMDVLPPVEPGIRCGDAQCDVEQKCCLRPPEAPYCAPAFLPCGCAPVATARDASASSD